MKPHWMKAFGLVMAIVVLAPAAQAEEAKAAAAPAPSTYSLILPANLPHLMAFIKKRGAELELDAAQKAEVEQILAEVPARIRPVFMKAQEAERAIARDVLAGQMGDDLAARLDDLEASKREAAEIHIACIKRVRKMLRPDQYARVLKMSGHPGEM